MSDATPIDAALTGLSELAGCDLRLAKRFCARIEALPEDADDKAMALSRSYQRMARSYRQTLVVQARLRRELKAEARADAGDARVARQARTYDLKAAIRADIRPHIWIKEREDERCESLERLADELVDEAAARLDFLDQAPQTHAAAILQVLDLEARDAEAADQADEADEDAPEPPTVSPSGGKRREGPKGRVADGGGDDGIPPPEAEPALPPEAEAQPPPDPPPDPDPPPRPPDPEPYIPPWEKNPYARYPGGSGW